MQAGTSSVPEERRLRPARWRGVAFVFFMTIPGLLIGLTVLAAIDRLGWWVTRRSGLPWLHDGRRPAPAPALDELQAMFHADKRHSIEQRTLEFVRRDDEHDGAPPLIEGSPGTGDGSEQP